MISFLNPLKLTKYIFTQFHNLLHSTLFLLKQNSRHKTYFFVITYAIFFFFQFVKCVQVNLSSVWNFDFSVKHL